MLTSLERNLEISHLCQDILSMNATSRCSFFINKNGRITESKFRDDGYITGLTMQELEMLYMQCKLQSSMNEEFEKKLGCLDYTLVRRESELHFIFPFYDGVIFVIVDKNMTIPDIGNKILKLIRKSDLEMKRLE